MNNTFTRFNNFICFLKNFQGIEWSYFGPFRITNITISLNNANGIFLYNLIFKNCLYKISIIKINNIIRLLLFFLVFYIFFNLFKANANIIRDTEIEEAIRIWANPIFEASGLNKDSIDIYLISDSSVNAFVTNGQKIFLNTGLLFKVSSASGLSGVIAHETGHITSGHIVRTREKIRSITLKNRELKEPCDEEEEEEEEEG